MDAVIGGGVVSAEDGIIWVVFRFTFGSDAFGGFVDVIFEVGETEVAPSVVDCHLEYMALGGFERGNLAA